MSEISLDRAEQVRNAEEAKKEALSIDNQKFAMWLYLGSEVVIFTVLIATYVVFRIREPEAVHHVHEALGFTGILLVTFNTFLLLTSSWSMVMGLREIQRDNIAGLNRWFSITAVLGAIFVVLQYVEYRRLGDEAVTLDFASDAFSGFGMHFYAPTAFHGAHVIVGVLWCLLVMNRARNGRYSSRNYVGVEIFGLYWHFVDVVWILLFTIIYLV
ncbi:MAG: cytochrome c oxidase subunit 3 [Aggregatilineales bacterium]